MFCKPRNHYGKIKLKCTKYALKLYKKENPISIIRLFSLYGKNQNKGLIFDTIKNTKKKNLFQLFE